MSALCPECGGRKWTEAEVETVEGGTESVCYVCQTCGIPACCRSEDGSFEMCPTHRREWDLRADLQDWRASKLWLEWWRAQAEWIGLESLTDVMRFAHAEANARIATLEAEMGATLADVVPIRGNER